jgi:hypothetical protein
MIDTAPFSRFGYYEVNGVRHYLKTEAFRAAGSNPKLVKYRWNDDFLRLFDWSKEPEPEVGLKEFYRRRAQQLRDKYDYVVLLWSGGPDSTNVLESFVNNGIMLDEVVNANSFERTGVHENTGNNADYVHNVKPVIDKMIADGRFKGRVTVLDEIDLMRQHYDYYNTHNRDFFASSFVVGNPGMVFLKGVWLRYVPHLWSMILSGKRVGVIKGADKPFVNIVNGKFSTAFSDISSGDLLSYFSQDADFSAVDTHEFFYHSPECVDLIIKQVSVVKKFLETNRDPNNFVSLKDMYSKKIRPHFTAVGKHFPGHNIKYNVYTKLVYPDWTPRLVTPKPTDTVSRGQDYWWFWQLSDEEKSFWTSRFKSHAYEFSHIWKNEERFLKQPIGFSYTDPLFLE